MIRTQPIGQHLEQVNSWNPAVSAATEEFLYIDLSAIDQEQKIITEARTVLGSEAPSRARQLVKFGDVLVSTVRPNLNGVAHVSHEFDGATASTGFCVLRANERTLSGAYLFHWVKTPQFIDTMVRQATGASYPAVSDSIVCNSKIPLPPMEEQRRIATILDQAEALRTKRRQAIAKLDTLTQSLFLEMLGEPIFNRRGLSVRSLGELLQLKSGDFLPAKDMAESGSFPVYGGNGINGYHDQYMFGDPVITIGRVGVYCGAIHVTVPRSWVTDNALYVSDHDREVDFEYLASALELANLNQYAGQAAQPLLSGSRIYPIKILVPPLELQRQFSETKGEIKRNRETYIRSQEKFNDLFFSAQKSAFEGSL